MMYRQSFKDIARFFALIFCFGILITLLLVSISASKENNAVSTQEVHLDIVKSEFTLYLKNGDTIVKKYPIAVGRNSGDKQKSGDCRTPEGDFYISNIQNSKNWSHDFKDGKGPINGAYGPLFFRLYTGASKTKSGKLWKGIGIHGTHDPSSIGKMVTEGCIRMCNEDIMELKKYVKIGTPVLIKNK